LTRHAAFAYERGMPEPRLPWEAGCRCGQVRLKISALPLLTAACHCTGCQRMTASAFPLSIAVPSEGFAVTRGEPVLGGLHGEARHHHCPHCKSWMFTKADAYPWFVNVRATMLDDPSWFVPFMETFTREKLPWATTPATHSYPGLPEMHEYAELTDAYARLRSAG
jgi:hypothetical protein